MRVVSRKLSNLQSSIIPPVTSSYYPHGALLTVSIAVFNVVEKWTYFGDACLDIGQIWCQIAGHLSGYFKDQNWCSYKSIFYKAFFRNMLRHIYLIWHITGPGLALYSDDVVSD